MIASLVRPIAVTKSGCGGDSGAVAMPSMIRASGNFSSCALCSATSSTRATICTLPARLRVGAYMKVRRSAATPQSLRNLIDDFDRRRLVAFEDQRRAIGVVRIAEIVK